MTEEQLVEKLRRLPQGQLTALEMLVDALLDDPQMPRPILDPQVEAELSSAPTDQLHRP
jgi:hypothetical protein